MKTKRVHHKKEPFDIYIGRPSKWGNPFSSKNWASSEFKVNSRKESIEKHKKWITEGDGKYLLDDIHELKGKVLGCWCNSNQSCHGDILVELANEHGKTGLETLFS